MGHNLNSLNSLKGLVRGILGVSTAAHILFLHSLLTLLDDSKVCSLFKVVNCLLPELAGQSEFRLIFRSRYEE